MLDDAYPLELLGAYASDSSTSDSFVDSNQCDRICQCVAHRYLHRRMLYIAGKPFAIATPNDLTDHNPTVTYELDTDGTLVSVEKTAEKELNVQLGKAGR